MREAPVSNAKTPDKITKGIGKRLCKKIQSKAEKIKKAASRVPTGEGSAAFMSNQWCKIE